jgi:hypothetical protein
MAVGGLRNANGGNYPEARYSFRPRMGKSGDAHFYDRAACSSVSLARVLIAL